jgi:hypothetical protein
VNGTAGGPAPGGTGVGALADDAAGSDVVITRPRVPRLRMVLVLAKVDASLLFRSTFILVGLVAGAFVIWAFGHTEQALWWNVGWQIGYGQVFIAMAALVAAQLAAGRPKRNAMADLYASFPASAAARTLAQLIGLVGAAPASLLLIGGTAAAVEIAGPDGVPSIWALAGGVLLVLAAGAAGIAIGVRFPHPLAGVLGALVLFVPFSQSNRLAGADIWLYPWIKPPQLDSLPGPLAGYPPVGAHAAELAGIAVLAGIIALVVTINGARARGVLVIAGIVSLAAICLAGAVQLRPIPTADLNELGRAVADPTSVQRCTTVGEGRYCLYPGFGSELSSIQAPVNAVLAHLPVQPADQLTIAQTAPLSPDPTLTHGHPDSQVSQWNAQLQASGDGSDVPSGISLPVTVRPSDARFYLALAAGEWAVRFQPTTTSNGPPCVPVDQAREAIAIWLALLATHTPAGQLSSGLAGPSGGQQAMEPVAPAGALVAIWTYPGQETGNLISFGPQTTAVGYELASAMTKLPEQQVSHVLQTAWAKWVDWQTTDAQLAAALGIPVPSVAQSDRTPAPGNLPLPPVCT